MYKGNKVLVIVPARGGSKGIPRKNLRLLAGKPLISYVIETIQKSNFIDELYISTDDDEIEYIAKKYNSKVVKRGEHLAEDNVPLDPVIYDAVLKIETANNTRYDIVVTVQPTSPLLKTETLDRAISRLVDNDMDTIISVVDDRHLAWTVDENNKYIPKYKARVNRQYLPKEFRETGGIFASKRKYVTSQSRLGQKIDLIEIGKDESIDIDSYSDWWIAEKLLKRKKILYRTDAYSEIGTGHVYRGLTLASRDTDHEIIFLLNSKYELGKQIIKNYNFKFIEFNENVFEKIDEIRPDIVINDILDTQEDYIKKLKDRNIFVINFEDMGKGAKLADVVFNALYDDIFPYKNHYSGYKYYCLRDEFYDYPPKKIKHTVDNILITFGGTDPNNLTEKVCDCILDMGYKGTINIILGLGYIAKEKLEAKYNNYNNITIYKVVKNISQYMYNADIVITSAGRTMYEVASLGTPCIVIAQNDREMKHLFAHTNNGVVNLGLGKDLTDKFIQENVLEIMNNHELRQEMSNRMLSVDLKNGYNNIVQVIKKHYKIWKEKTNGRI